MLPMSWKDTKSISIRLTLHSVLEKQKKIVQNMISIELCIYTFGFKDFHVWKRKSPSTGIPYLNHVLNNYLFSGLREHSKATRAKSGGQSFETCAVGCSGKLDSVISTNWYPVCKSAWTSSADSCGMTSTLSAEGCRLHSCSVYKWVKNYSFPFILGLIMITIINIKLFCFID